MFSVMFFIFFVKQPKSAFYFFVLFNLCNSEKNGKIRLHGGEHF